MLVLSRRRDESIVIGEDIVVIVVDIRGDKVRLGIESPKEVPVHRREVYEAIQRENLRASQLERKAAEPTPQQLIPAEPQKTPYQQFRGYLDGENYSEAGRIYIAPDRNFEASREEQDKLIKGLYTIIKGSLK